MIKFRHGSTGFTTTVAANGWVKKSTFSAKKILKLCHEDMLVMLFENALILKLQPNNVIRFVQIVLLHTDRR